MQSVRSAAAALPTDLAGLPGCWRTPRPWACNAFLFRPTQGIPSLVLALVWLVLAWRGTGRPHHVAELREPLLAALLGRDRLPSATTLYRSLRRFSAQAVRGAVETAYQAELSRRTERVWVSLDSHQLPYWGRGQRDRFQNGWAGNHGRRLSSSCRIYASSPSGAFTLTAEPGRSRGGNTQCAAQHKNEHQQARGIVYPQNTTFAQ
jgi:hypothetical protein